MSFSETTKPTIDGAGSSFNQVAIDKGSGVFLPVHVRARFDGSLVQSEWSHAAQVGGISNTTTAETLVAAAGSGLRNYLSTLDISASDLGGATTIVVRDGAGGTVLWRGGIPAAGLNLTQLRFDPPLRSSVATLLEVATPVAVTGGIYINASGFVAA